MKQLSILAILSVLCLPFVVSAQDRPASAIKVVEVKLGKGVQDRKITDEAMTFAVNDKVYLWMRLSGGPSDPIKVTWEIGEHKDTVELKVSGDPWRTWSNKTVWKAGEWKATISAPNGETLKEVSFTVQ